LVTCVVEGMAGVGKTALAVHWSHRVRDRFPDGQLYVNLRGYGPQRPLRPVEALATLLPALGVPGEQVPIDLDGAAGLYRSVLAGRRVLLLLDNAHRPEQVRPLLPGTAGCLVLITARDALDGLVVRDGARRLRLGVLTRAEAVSLLDRLLATERAPLPAELGEAVARRCGYLPVALRIAAANIAGQPAGGLAGYLAALERDQLTALDVPGDEGTALPAVFALSYTAQPPATRRAFRLLGLAPGPDITPDAAAALLDVTGEQAGSQLDRLAAAYLVIQHRPGRYAFHDLVHAYAADRARREERVGDRRAALVRLLEHYTQWTDAAARTLSPHTLRLPAPAGGSGAASFSGPAEAAAWLDRERANLVAAATYAEEHGPRHPAWQLADGLRAYFLRRGHMTDWLQVARSGLAAARADGNLQAEAAALNSLAALDWRQGRHRQALRHLSGMLDCAERAGWLEAHAAALGSRASVHADLGELDRAAADIAAALDLSRRTGQRGAQAVNLANLGHLRRSQGRLLAAMQHHTQALALYLETGSDSGRAMVLANIGDVCHGLGRLDDARRYLTAAVQLSEDVGNPAAQVDAMTRLAAVHSETGDHQAGLDLADSAVALAGDNHLHREQTDALNVRGTVLLGLGRHQEARDSHLLALQTARGAGERWSEVEALIGLARANRELHRRDQARLDIERAQTLASGIGYRVLEGQALTVLARLQVDQHQPDLAVRTAGEALAIQRDTGHLLGQARAHLVLSHALREAGQPDAADASRQEADALFRRVGAPLTGEPVGR
jgi:tetratricopeptide (TPR) repeat protein